MVVKWRAGIGAHGDQDAAPVSFFEAHLMALRHGFRFAQDAFWNAAPESASGSGGQRRECRYHKDTLLFHHDRGFFVHERGMFDRMNSGSDGILHPRRSMGMGGDFPPSSLRLFHGGPELLHGHLRLVRRGAWRENAA